MFARVATTLDLVDLTFMVADWGIVRVRSRYQSAELSKKYQKPRFIKKT
jgi:hypothetical protein